MLLYRTFQHFIFITHLFSFSFPCTLCYQQMLWLAISLPPFDFYHTFVAYIYCIKQLLCKCYLLAFPLFGHGLTIPCVIFFDRLSYTTLRYLFFFDRLSYFWCWVRCDFDQHQTFSCAIALGALGLIVAPSFCLLHQNFFANFTSWPLFPIFWQWSHYPLPILFWSPILFLMLGLLWFWPA